MATTSKDIVGLESFTVPETAAGLMVSGRRTRVLVVNAGLDSVTGQLLECDATGIVVAGGWSDISLGQAFKAADPYRTTGVIFGASNGLTMYFVTGSTTYQKYTLSSTGPGTVANWTASAGSMPTANSEGCRLIESWRGTFVMSGLRGDPHNWFMPRVDSVSDFDYAPVSASPTQAVAGNNAPAGQIGDVVNTIIPWDQQLVFGGDHSVWLLDGHPADGGRLTQVLNGIGLAFGRPWCIGPDGTLYCYSVGGEVYAWPKGGRPIQISQVLGRQLDRDLAQHHVRMVWDTRTKGFYLFLTPTNARTEAIHWFWEERTGGWFSFSFANPKLNPKTVCVVDGDKPDDRHILLSSWDGFVYTFDGAEPKDAIASPIESEVWLGPLLTPTADEMMIVDLVAVLAEDSGVVSYAVHVGQTPEQALASTPVATGFWGAGRNRATPVRRVGHALFVKITSTTAHEDGWAFESLRATVVRSGALRGRSK